MCPGIVLLNGPALLTDQGRKVGVAQLKAFSFLRLESGTGALSDHFASMLSQHSLDANW